MIEASTTRRPRTPKTFAFESTTAPLSAALPIAQVEVACQMGCAADLMNAAISASVETAWPGVTSDPTTMPAIALLFQASRTRFNAATRISMSAGSVSQFRLMTGASNIDAVPIVTLPLENGVNKVPLIAPTVVRLRKLPGNPEAMYSTSGQSEGKLESNLNVRDEKALRLLGGNFSKDRYPPAELYGPVALFKYSCTAELCCAGDAR